MCPKVTEWSKSLQKKVPSDHHKDIMDFTLPNSENPSTQPVFLITAGNLALPGGSWFLFASNLQAQWRPLAKGMRPGARKAPRLCSVQGMTSPWWCDHLNARQKVTRASVTCSGCHGSFTWNAWEFPALQAFWGVQDTQHPWFKFPVAAYLLLHHEASGKQPRANSWRDSKWGGRGKKSRGIWVYL